MRSEWCCLLALEPDQTFERNIPLLILQWQHRSKISWWWCIIKVLKKRKKQKKERGEEKGEEIGLLKEGWHRPDRYSQREDCPWKNISNPADAAILSIVFYLVNWFYWMCHLTMFPNTFYSDIGKQKHSMFVCGHHVDLYWKTMFGVTLSFWLLPGQLV